MPTRSGAAPEEVVPRVAEAFGRGAFGGAERLGDGLIHTTWGVRCGDEALVLQELNTEIFGDPARLMENVVRTTEHLRARLVAEGTHEPERRCLRVMPTRAGESFHREPGGRPWRAFRRIENARTCLRLAGPDQAEEAARAFGSFARRLADLPAPALHETLPRFHDFAARCAALEAAMAADARGRATAVRDEVAALRARSGEIQAALEAGDAGDLPRRVAHHDCKLSNLLFDADGDEALCVIDLDTVMPGTLLSDFGELVRSSTNTAAEDEPDPARVGFDLAIFDALARGYVAGVGPLLTDRERDALPLAGPLLTLMNAVRFLTDHLAGDVYFRTDRPDHNLDRARAQLALAEAMRAAGPALAESVRSAAG